MARARRAVARSVASIREARIPMPDGVALAADLYVPARPALATLLLRTPYGRRRLVERVLEVDPRRALEAGFAVAIQDVRGRGDSEGAFDAMLGDGADGAATVAWIRDQPWSGGRVAMVGDSYSGTVQFLAAQRRPCGLFAIAPCMSGSLRDVWFPGGALRLAGVTSWAQLHLAATLAGPERHGRPRPAEALAAFAAASPLERLHRLLDGASELDALTAPIRAWFGSEPDAPYWRQIDVPGDVDVAGMHITGWYDVCLGPTMDAYAQLVRRGAERADAPPQHAILGPWNHGLQAPDWYMATVPEVDASYAMLDWQLSFLLELLGDRDARREPAVRSYVLGADRWESLSGWPPRDATPRTWHCARDERSGALALLPGTPPDAAAVSFRFDPRDPVPTVGGATCMPDRWGPRDVAALERRADVLAFASAPLGKPLELAGAVRAQLSVASSAPATDFVARLTVRRPNGEAIVLREGYWSGRLDALPRAAARSGARSCTIELGHVHAVIAPGERLALQVTSSDYPEIYPNPNTGHRLADGAPAHVATAEQTIVCGGLHGSTLSIDAR